MGCVGSNVFGGAMMAGVVVRDTGDCERSDPPDLSDTRREAGSGVPWAERECPFKRACGHGLVGGQYQEPQEAHLSGLLEGLSGVLDPIPALDDIGLQTDGPGPTMQLQEQATGIAEHRAGLVSAPERRSRGLAVLANWL